jgi:hypothetical protein
MSKGAASWLESLSSSTGQSMSFFWMARVVDESNSTALLVLQPGEYRRDMLHDAITLPLSIHRCMTDHDVINIDETLAARWRSSSTILSRRSCDCIGNPRSKRSLP